MSGRKPTDRSKTTSSSAANSNDVEELLRAAEDELLLNLSINSHAARGSSHASSSYLDPDLHRRFQSLKSSKPPPRHRPNENRASGSAGACGEDDLLARFAALKGSISSPSPSPLPAPPGLGTEEEDDDGDELDKVMRWAIDAARLDPSPESDDDDEVDTNYGSSSDNEDEEDNRRSKDSKKVNKKK